MMKRLARLACTALVGLALAACGGGGGGGTAAGDPPDGPPQGPAQPAYTAKQRADATAGIADKYEQLLASRHPDRWEALKAYALSRPEFVEAGYGGDTLWARFTDGRYFVYVDNWQQIREPAAARSFPAAAMARAPEDARPAAAAAAAGELPRSARATLLRLDGEVFTHTMTDGTHYSINETIARVGQSLKSRGWQVPVDHNISVEALMDPTEHGILFLATHGGEFGQGDARQYSVITATPSTDENEERFADELDDHSLVYARARHWWTGLDGGRMPHYAITATFVRKYMKFSPNSLVVLLLCNGGTDAAAGLRAALTEKDAGTIVAWNGYSNVLAYDFVELLFDRLTGANAVTPPVPPNRTFHFDDVWSYLEKKGKLITPPGDPTVPGARPTPIKRFGAGFDLTNPVITQMQLQVGDKMVLHGDFGSVPGTVMVGGTPRPATWLADGSSVLVQLDAEAYGDVQVTARGRKSNVRTLVSWKGKVTYEYQDLPDPVSNAGGILSNRVEVDLHLRSDGYQLRSEVDATPVDNTWNVIPASDTTARWRAEGTRTIEGRAWETWSGSGRLDVVFPFLGRANEMGLIARFAPSRGRFEFTPMFTQLPKVTVTRRDGSSLQPLRFDFRHYGFYRTDEWGFFDHQPLPFGTFVPFDAQLNVPASRHVATIGGNERMIVTWTRMTPLPAYRADAPR